MPSTLPSVPLLDREEQILWADLRARQAEAAAAAHPDPGSLPDVPWLGVVAGVVAGGITFASALHVAFFGTAPVGNWMQELVLCGIGGTLVSAGGGLAAYEAASHGAGTVVKTLIVAFITLLSLGFLLLRLSAGVLPEEALAWLLVDVAVLGLVELGIYTAGQRRARWFQQEAAERAAAHAAAAHRDEVDRLVSALNDGR